MNCKKIFTRDFLSENCTNIFITKNLKTHRENILLDHQKCLLPETQPYVVLEKERKKIDNQVRELMKEQEHFARLIREKSDQIKNLQNTRRNIRLEITGDASSDNIEIKKFIRKCPIQDCRGFLSSRWKCGVCDTNICNKCNEPKNIDIEHICDPQNIETMILLNKDTKPCPKCGTMICKISGCDQMFCPDCHTAFSWNRGTIETGIIHNPHYYEFLRKNNNGVVPRNPGDIPCGGIPDYYTFRIINDVRFSNIHQTLTHIQNVEIRRYNYIENEELINRDLRIKYLMNEINDAQLKQVLQQNEKANQKIIEFRNIYQMFCDVGSDIFRQMVDEYYKIVPRNIKNPSLEQKERICDYSKQQLIILDRLIEYFNDNLKKVGKIYKCVYPGINKNYRWEYNFETYLKKNTL
jgi:hypothetical protein